MSLICRSSKTVISVRLGRNRCSREPKSVFGRFRNQCSRETGMGVREDPEWVFDLGRNTHSNRHVSRVSQYRYISCFHDGMWWCAYPTLHKTRFASPI